MAAVPPAPTVTNLNTFSTGIVGTKFKKGNTWNVAPADWEEKKIGVNVKRKLDGKPPGFKDITYMNYDLTTLKADGFPQETISTLDNKYKIGKTARVYAKTIPELDKLESEFQKAVDAHRTAQLKSAVAEKKGTNQKEWNAMTAGISKETKAELDKLTQEYFKKKAELEKQLEAAFKAQTKQLVINKQWNTKDKYADYLQQYRVAKPGVKEPEGARGPINLSGALDAAGRPIINSIKVGSTRKRHRFIHLLVTPKTSRYEPPVIDLLSGSAQPSTGSLFNGLQMSPMPTQAQPPVPIQAQAPVPVQTQPLIPTPVQPPTLSIRQPLSGQPPSGQPPSPPGTPNTPSPMPKKGGKRKTKRNPRHH